MLFDEHFGKLLALSQQPFSIPLANSVALANVLVLLIF